MLPDRPRAPSGQRPGHLEVEIACTLGFAPRRHPVRPGRRGQQRRGLQRGEHLRGTRRVVPCTRIPARMRPVPGAACPSSTRVRQVRNCSPAKKLTWTNFTPFSTRPLSGGSGPWPGPRPGRGPARTPATRGSPQLHRSALSTTGLRLSGISTLNMPRKKLPCRLAAGDHRSRRLRERRYTKQYRDSTAVNTSAWSGRLAVPVGDHPQVAEVDLHLFAGLAVGHRHRHLCRRPPRTARPRTGAASAPPQAVLPSSAGTAGRRARVRRRRNGYAVPAGRMIPCVALVAASSGVRQR